MRTLLLTTGLRVPIHCMLKVDPYRTLASSAADYIRSPQEPSCKNDALRSGVVMFGGHSGQSLLNPHGSLTGL